MVGLVRLIARDLRLSTDFHQNISIFIKIEKLPYNIFIQKSPIRRVIAVVLPVWCSAWYMDSEFSKCFLILEGKTETGNKVK